MWELIQATHLTLNIESNNSIIKGQIVKDQEKLKSNRFMISFIIGITEVFVLYFNQYV